MEVPRGAFRQVPGEEEGGCRSRVVRHPHRPEPRARRRWNCARAVRRIPCVDRRLRRRLRPGILQLAWDSHRRDPHRGEGAVRPRRARQRHARRDRAADVPGKVPSGAAGRRFQLPGQASLRRPTRDLDPDLAAFHRAPTRLIRGHNTGFFFCAADRRRKKTTCIVSPVLSRRNYFLPALTAAFTSAAKSFVSLVRPSPSA